MNVDTVPRGEPAPSTFTSIAERSGARNHPAVPTATNPTPRTFQAVAEPMARRQHGVVARRDLLEAGLPVHIVDQRVRSGRLTVVHRGVYVLEGLGTTDTHLVAAALACGRTALISHKSAGARWGMLHWLEPPELVDVSGPGLVRRRPGIRIHRSHTLNSTDGTRLDGIPITTPTRTLADVAPLLASRALERAVAEALALGLATERTLRESARRGTGLPGAERFREVLGLDAPARTRSEAEERLLALVRAARLPEPQAHVRVSRYEVDLFWPSARLAVEVDGFAFHGSRRSFERDRRRDRVLLAKGIRVMRITARQIQQEPGKVLTSVMRVLGEGSAARDS